MSSTNNDKATTTQPPASKSTNKNNKKKADKERKRKQQRAQMFQESLTDLIEDLTRSSPQHAILLTQVCDKKDASTLLQEFQDENSPLFKSIPVDILKTSTVGKEHLAKFALFNSRIYKSDTNENLRRDIRKEAQEKLLSMVDDPTLKDLTSNVLKDLDEEMKKSQDPMTLIMKTLPKMMLQLKEKFDSGAIKQEAMMSTGQKILSTCTSGEGIPGMPDMSGMAENMSQLSELINAKYEGQSSSNAQTQEPLDMSQLTNMMAPMMEQMEKVSKEGGQLNPMSMITSMVSAAMDPNKKGSVGSISAEEEELENARLLKELEDSIELE